MARKPKTQTAAPSENNRYTLITTDDEMEILRFLAYRNSEDNRANLVRNLLRESPQVKAAMKELEKPDAFQDRQWGGYRKQIES